MIVAASPGTPYALMISLSNFPATVKRDMLPELGYLSPDSSPDITLRQTRALIWQYVYWNGLQTGPSSGLGTLESLENLETWFSRIKTKDNASHGDQTVVLSHRSRSTEGPSHSRRPITIIDPLRSLGISSSQLDENRQTALQQGWITVTTNSDIPQGAQSGSQ